MVGSKNERDANEDRTESDHSPYDNARDHTRTQTPLRGRRSKRWRAAFEEMALLEGAVEAVSARLGVRSTGVFQVAVVGKPVAHHTDLFILFAGDVRAQLVEERVQHRVHRHPESHVYAAVVHATATVSSADGHPMTVERTPSAASSASSHGWTSTGGSTSGTKMRRSRHGNGRTWLADACSLHARNAHLVHCHESGMDLFRKYVFYENHFRGIFLKVFFLHCVFESKIENV